MESAYNPNTPKATVPASAINNFLNIEAFSDVRDPASEC
jgi:hypothetical protein